MAARRGLGAGGQPALPQAPRWRQPWSAKPRRAAAQGDVSAGRGVYVGLARVEATARVVRGQEKLDSGCRGAQCALGE